MAHAVPPITWVKNEMQPLFDARYKRAMALLTEAEVAASHRFHESLPHFAPTPLVSLPALARRLGIKSFLIKDESMRCGLNSFKALGGSWALANYCAGILGMDAASLDFAALTSDAAKQKLGDLTFYSTTDGNHGRGVAWSARQLRQKCVIYMPKGTAQSRYDNIAKEGARVTITDMNYDDCIRFCAAEVKKDPRGVLVQDTDWEGYEDIPAWIMQGYASVAFEAHHQMEEQGAKATHILGQAGVGSFDASLHGYFANVSGGALPLMLTVESDKADCFARSSAAGEKRIVGGDMDTIMAGLACGEPSNMAWSILRNHSRYFVSIPDWVAAKGMRTLSSPLPNDRRVISGESGAATAGFVLACLLHDEYKPLARELGFDKDSVVLCVSTEGDTCPEMWERVCHDGAFPSA